MTSKKSKSQDHNLTKKKKSSIQKDNPEKSNKSTVLDPIAEIFKKLNLEYEDVTEKMEGQVSISFRPRNRGL